jgi:hypothetical protein
VSVILSDYTGPRWMALGMHTLVLFLSLDILASFSLRTRSDALSLTLEHPMLYRRDPRTRTEESVVPPQQLYIFRVRNRGREDLFSTGNSVHCTVYIKDRRFSRLHSRSISHGRQHQKIQNSSLQRRVLQTDTCTNYILPNGWERSG